MRAIFQQNPALEMLPLPHVARRAKGKPIMLDWSTYRPSA